MPATIAGKLRDSRRLAGWRMDANAYAVRYAALAAAEAAVDKAVEMLSAAAQHLREASWKEIPERHWKAIAVPGWVPGRTAHGDEIRPMKLDPWPTIEEIKTLAEAYWSARAAAEEAWGALPPKLQRIMSPPGRVERQQSF